LNIAIIIYLCICILIGILGKNRLLGFWGFFFLSLFTTPLIGALVLGITANRALWNLEKTLYRKKNKSVDHF